MARRAKPQIYTISCRVSEELVDAFKVVTDWHCMSQSAMMRSWIVKEVECINKERTRSRAKPPTPLPKVTVVPRKT